MSKILVDSEEYFKLKNRINELFETNKKLKEKYVYLEKRVGCDTDLSVLKETIDVLRKKQNEISKKLENIQQENDDLKNANTELTLLKNDAETKHNKIQKENDDLKNVNKELTILKNEAETKRNNIQKENNKLKKMVEELENIPRITDGEVLSKNGISICLTAWQTQNYIEDCLNSIESQTYFKDFGEFEILLGIDGCENTFSKVKKIQHKYRNLRVFMMNKNVGTYIVSNTMMSLAKYDYILRFDTDDIMMPNMIESVMNYMYFNPNVDMLRPYAINFGDKSGMLYDKHGCVLVKKQVFRKFGGYRPWTCAADGEFQRRVEKFIKIEKYRTVVFKRRIHSNNLTIAKNTNFGSDIRKNYIKFIETHTYKNMQEAIIKCETADYTENILPEKYQLIVSMTSYPGRFKYVPEVVNSILKNSMKPHKFCLCIYKDDEKFLTKDIKQLISTNKIELIIADENLRPHCKYYYTMKKYKNHPIITIDDDLMYDVDTVKSLYDSYIKYPTCISARRVHKILYENKVATDYGRWTKEYTKDTKPNKNLIATGVGGVLYPPDILKIDEILLEDINKCLLADDIFLKWREDRLRVLTVWVKNTKLNGFKINEAANSSTALFRVNCNKNKNSEYLKIFKLYE